MIISFNSKHIPIFNELVIKNTLVKRVYGSVSPTSETKVIKSKQNLSLQSIFPIKFYQPEEDTTVGQISDKDVQCFSCLFVSTLNSEIEIN